jgi:hypothetical protein
MRKERPPCLPCAAASLACKNITVYCHEHSIEGHYKGYRIEGTADAVDNDSPLWVAVGHVAADGEGFTIR